MSNEKKRLVRVATIPLSLKMFCHELLLDLMAEYDVLAVSSDGKELNDLKNDGIPTHIVEMERAISPISDLRSLLALIKLFRRVRPDIVHSMTPKAGLLAMMAARLTGVPIRIHSFTGLLFPTATGIKKTILKTTDRITCACATHILPEGHGVRQDLINGKITNKELKVLGNGNLRGINLSYYIKDDNVMQAATKIKGKWKIADNTFTFIFIGRVVKDKGITELIESFRRLIEERHRVNLILVGVEEPNEDPLPEATRQLIDTTPNIYFTREWVDDVRPYYAISDALVFPSYREGFPNVVLEAGAMGLPSIVTDINGSREIITNGINGDIIPVKDSEALYKAMKRYVNNRQYVDQMATRCRDIIASKYECNYVRNCLKEFYRSL